jgi:4-hydroxybenzoate polyprenyltransferase
MSLEPQTFARTASAPYYIWIAIGALRLHHWLKNCLLFVPVAAAHDLSPSALGNLCIGFVAFGCAASAHYLINDLRDKEQDQLDPAKRRRPQAAGQLSARDAIRLATILIAAAAACASWLPADFQVVLAVYFLICLGYTFLLKRIPVIDILTLTVLLALRLVAGTSAAAIPLPPTLLLVFSCLFFTLAVLKRMAPFAVSQSPTRRLPSRPYSRANLPALRVLAGIAGGASIATLAILLSRAAEQAARPALLWCALVVATAWLGRCFFLVERGRLSEDLVFFIATDLFSYITLAVLAVLLLAAG